MVLERLRRYLCYCNEWKKSTMLKLFDQIISLPILNFLKPRFSGGLFVANYACYLFFYWRERRNSFHLQLATLVHLSDGCIFTGVNKCLFLISPLRTKVTPLLSLESFWISLLLCVHTIFWYHAKHPVETVVVIKGTEGDFEVWR